MVTEIDKLWKADPNPELFRACKVGLVDERVRRGGRKNRLNQQDFESDPTGIRTRVFAVRGRCT